LIALDNLYTHSVALMPDRRYGSRRWLRVRMQVLRRDRFLCRIVEGCMERATVADHIIPASAGTPDALFFSAANLRAGCRDHNLARGFASRPRVVAPEPGTAVVTKDYTR
jgi:5-methylcytosine-specific restriction endonuclease McrA